MVSAPKAEARCRRAVVKATSIFLPDGQIGKKTDVLERTSDAGDGRAARSNIVDSATVDGDLPRIDIQKRGNHVQERGLARAIRPDQTDDLARAAIKRHAVDRRHALETLGNVRNLKPH